MNCLRNSHATRFMDKKNKRIYNYSSLSVERNKRMMASFRMLFRKSFFYDGRNISAKMCELFILFISSDQVYKDFSVFPIFLSLRSSFKIHAFFISIAFVSVFEIFWFHYLLFLKNYLFKVSEIPKLLNLTKLSTFQKSIICKFQMVLKN